MINFINVRNGEIQLYDNRDLMVKQSSSAAVLAAAIKSCGGPADRIYASSACDIANEYGFQTQKAFDDLWHDVCELL